MQKGLVKAGLSGRRITVHTMRHAFATHLIEQIELRLLPEDQRLGDPPPAMLDPFDTRIHPTMGYYEVVAADRFDEAQRDGFLPEDMRQKGKVDFVRRNYERYPDQAVC